MASILRKALKNQFQSATTRIINNLNKSEPAILRSTPPQPPILAHPSCSRRNQIPFCLERETEDVSPCSLVYPSFSFGLFLNPISQIGVIKSENDGGVAVEEDSLKIWADSVKKKRKKKMNKHKLKKLRKRLRRKTKA
ncbi:hypothetical protein R3W88_007151 [Solanum pinnatisectum]|uniref:Small ribosomal subunit protein mS38 n=1 Tax=Solanum pinnatisectum TaxID=50273 RepID=A0AAV9KHN6_9SOLN|nr:hypothetical protein R3W88_007151 [Solanum pinnatisectum]